MHASFKQRWINYKVCYFATAIFAELFSTKKKINHISCLLKNKSYNLCDTIPLTYV